MDPSSHIRFVDISQMLRVTDPRSGARLYEAQDFESMRLSINWIGTVRRVKLQRER